MPNTIMSATTNNNNHDDDDDDVADSTSVSVQGIIEAVYTSTAQWVGQCTGTTIQGGTESKIGNSCSSGSTFHRQQPQQQQQQHEEKDDDGIHVVEHHQSNGGKDGTIDPSTPLAIAADSYYEDGEEEKKTDEAKEAHGEPHPSSLSSSSEQFTKVVQDALEGYSLAVCLNPFWTTTECDQHDSKVVPNHASTETQRSKQRKKRNKKHKKRKQNHKQRHQQKCSDGDIGEVPSTEREYNGKEYDLDKSDDEVVLNSHGPTSPPAEAVEETIPASCDNDGDHDDDDDDIDDDEMDDTIDSLATRGSVGTMQTNYTTAYGGSNTVMSNSVRSDTRSIHSFLMVNEPHRSSTTFSMSPSNQPQSYSLSHPYTKPKNSPFTPSKYSTLLESMKSPNDTKNNKHTPLLSPSMGLTQSIAETDEEVRSPTDNVLTPSLMQQIKHHLPFGRRDDSFWLQYSMVRDGASIGQLLRHVVDCNCRYSVLAVETMDGEIFGSYLSHSWEQAQPKHWYGGGESFLWTTAYHDTNESGVTKAGHTASSIYSKPPSIREMNVGSAKNRPSSSNRNRNSSSSCSSINRRSATHGDQNFNNEKDSTQLHVYHYTFANSYIQLCEHDRLLMGGGFSSADGNQDEGFGLALDGDLLMGSSHQSPTFGNPSLSFVHRDGSPFEIRNIEVWSLHPCLSLVESDGRKVIHRSRSSRPKTKQLKPSSSSKQHLPSKKKYQGPLVGTQSMSEDFESSDKRLAPNRGSEIENYNNGFDPYGR